jgi:hypothetical protein
MQSTKVMANALSAGFYRPLSRLPGLADLTGAPGMIRHLVESMPTSKWFWYHRLAWRIARGLSRATGSYCSTMGSWSGPVAAGWPVSSQG